MPISKPSLELLRQLSDEHVLRALMIEPHLTRAEIASRTGISKPTVGESVRRLVEAGVLIDTGERTTGRGRVGSYFALAPDVGYALAVSLAPEGITAELVDGYGATAATATVAVDRPPRPRRVSAQLAAVCQQVQSAVSAPTRLAVVSAADPVDRQTGRLVRLPDAPFLLGGLSPADALAPFVDGPITVDNDVNWAARTERSLAAAGRLDDFVYLYLGEGLGCAVVADGEVRRGSSGLAGELAHLITTGPDGRVCPLIDVFGQLGLRHEGTTAIDVTALIATVGRANPHGRRVLAALGQALAGVVSAVVALTDPAVIVVGGTWGMDPAVLGSIREHGRQSARKPTLRPAAAGGNAALAGARCQAVAELRSTITGYRTTGSFGDR